LKKYEIRPHFLDSTSNDRLEMKVVLGINIFIIVFCLTYLFERLQAVGGAWYVGGGWYEGLILILVGYFVADFMSGLVHWSIDTWFDEMRLGRIVSIAREHHTHPQNILGYGFLEHAALGSVGSVVLMGPTVLLTSTFQGDTSWCLMVIWTVTATCLLFGTSFHNLAHKRTSNKLVLWLQRAGFVISPKHHWAHHRVQTIRYCTISGWADHVCDALRVWRGLEILVRKLSGATPRANDSEWQRIFLETGTLTPPSILPEKGYGAQ
jgi:plasmanylethanolamine desaturase